MGAGRRCRKPSGRGRHLGSEYVARAAPDGYTLVLGVTGSHGINTSLYKNMRYDPRKDFEPLHRPLFIPTPSSSTTMCRPRIFRADRPFEKGVVQYSYGSERNGTASHLAWNCSRTRETLR
nr:tripartite tricarboxylate transporter substrate-binding protein [Bordetella holmesii]